MKNIILTCALVMVLLQMNAQVANDSVAVGAGYANQVWYSLENGVVETAPKNNWDIAFEIPGVGYSVHVNSEGGAEAWLYSTDVTEWSTIDTTGLSSLAKLYNSDTTWFIGAFDGVKDPNNDFDLGWGTYSLATHTVTGDKIYVVKLTNGTYQKLMIEGLASGTYTFRHANMDGTGEMTHTVAKPTYNTKNLVYYSLVNHAVVDREPARETWDLVFGQYFANVPDGNGGFVPYSVTGVRTNAGVKTAKTENLADAENYVDYEAETFESNISAIGHYWKSINMTTFQWDITDSLAYFVSTRDGDIWKVIMTGFTGSSTGTYRFSTEKLLEADTVTTEPIDTTTGIFSPKELAATMVVYPNPSNGQHVTVVYNILSQADAATLNVYDLAGRQVYAAELGNTAGVQQHRLPAQELNTGMYIVTLTVNNQQTHQKLIIK